MGADEITFMIIRGNMTLYENITEKLHKQCKLNAFKPEKLNKRNKLNTNLFDNGHLCILWDNTHTLHRNWYIANQMGIDY